MGSALLTTFGYGCLVLAGVLMGWHWGSRSARREMRRAGAPYVPPIADPRPPAAAALHDGALTEADDFVLRMLAGATFTGGATVVLPSGVTLNADEAQALTAVYAKGRAAEPSGEPTDAP
jgi:hypothetical protein